MRKTLLVGCGPANLALLTCLEETNSHLLGSTQVFERRDNAAWHPGLEFENSTLQVSLFKDLAFLRNPARACHRLIQSSVAARQRMPMNDEAVFS
jgi:lysine/ornithine N-monooxygenase